jgi:hypothetical protein
MSQAPANCRCLQHAPVEMFSESPAQKSNNGHLTKLYSELASGAVRGARGTSLSKLSKIRVKKRPMPDGTGDTLCSSAFASMLARAMPRSLHTTSKLCRRNKLAKVCQASKEARLERTALDSDFHPTYKTKIQCSSTVPANGRVRHESNTMQEQLLVPCSQ